MDDHSFGTDMCNERIRFGWQPLAEAENAQLPSCASFVVLQRQVFLSGSRFDFRIFQFEAKPTKECWSARAVASQQPYSLRLLRHFAWVVVFKHLRHCERASNPSGSFQNNTRHVPARAAHTRSCHDYCKGAGVCVPASLRFV